MEDFPNIYAKANVQVIIDGSFAVDTMTSPDSEFPMPQIFPREFSEAEQRSFVSGRFKEIGLNASEGFYVFLWDTTLGDKYFTQALCRRLAIHWYQEQGKILGEEEFDSCLYTYINNERSDQLKRSLINSIKALSELWGGNDLMLRGVIENINDSWDSLPKEARSIAYKGGLVRRQGIRGVNLRAPLVLRLYRDVARRVRQVKDLCNSYFEVEGLPEPYVHAGVSALSDIFDAAYHNNLMALHVGHGRKIGNSEISVEAVALHHGQYEGIVRVSVPESVKVNDEIWYLFWSWQDTEGGTASKIRTFPVKPVTYWPHI